MKNVELKKPAEIKKGLKRRVEVLRSQVPNNWILLFIHDHPEYKGNSVFLTSVMRGGSLHEETIEKLEAWVKTLGKEAIDATK